MGAPLCSVSRLCRASWRAVRPGCQRLHQTQPTGKETHFGFQTVSEEEKGERVYQVFENVAKNYDLMNDSMSLGIHRLWKDWLVRYMNPTPGTQLLDVAGGTGDVAFRFINYVQAQREKIRRNKLDHQQNLSWSDISMSYSQEQKGSLMGSKAVICDINKEMLKVGREKSLQLGYSEGLSWVAGDAEELPFADEKFDIYTIAFGIRNVTHLEKVSTKRNNDYSIICLLVFSLIILLPIKNTILLLS
ncbi:hypothetical protein GDO78_007285 [Eleutherodactylus coqui]|uniref:2-methoxy-6-polyprenyl-1,4-benzoquinol methylase, mitochondrial n=1 Tax=Eleutherodactylus coqui TaxID=57060 RepID=A0A8J6KFR9_ELECQ|nr:hypothetical protein GDO78_007285 [Eleutherodactylus coqui]